MAPGGFRVLRVISERPHGRMYLARDASGRRVALKELLFALVPAVEELDAFEREARILRDLSHPHIPRFVTSFSEGTGAGTRLYLAQELVEGESLLDRLRRQPLSEDEAWDIAEQALRILAYLHSRTPRLVHRDLKPANLILRPDGSVALVDFGAARPLARDHTHGSTLVGTFGYMPPEQLGGTVDTTSDLYALGATLVHLISGKSPADLVTDGMELSFEPHVRGSPHLHAFLRRLVSRKRAHRFGSAEEALAFIGRRAAAAGPARRLGARRLLRWVAVAGAMLGAGWALSQLLPRPVPPLLVPGPPPPPAVFEPAPPLDEPIPRPPPPAPAQGGRHRHFRTPWPEQPSRP